MAKRSPHEIAASLRQFAAGFSSFLYLHQLLIEAAEALEAAP